MTRVKLRHMDKTMIIDSLAHRLCPNCHCIGNIHEEDTSKSGKGQTDILYCYKKHWLILTPNLRKMIFLDFEKLSVDTGFRTKDCLAVKLSALHWDEFKFV